MSIYANTARFDSARALTETELRAKAPSIFAETAHESRSDKFRPIPTIQILQALQKEGFEPVGARQSLTRVPGKADFTKHMIRLRRLDDAVKHTVNGTVFEMILKNANDGTCQYDLMGGLWRILCMNSMVALQHELDSVKVRHTGNPHDVAHKVIEGTYRVMETAHNLLDAPRDWSRIPLDADQRLAFAEAVHTVRFGEPETDEHGEPVPHLIAPSKLLTVRRREDVNTDLWTVFNVAQENAVRGGLNGYRADSTVRRGFRRIATRAVTGIDQDVRLNKALWALGQRMAELNRII